jgi:hypothetical protein
MRSRTAFGLALALASLAAGCGGEEEGKAACGPAPAAIASPPKLPDGFPTPGGVTYTSSKAAGPSTIVDGYRDGELGDAFNAYKHGFVGAGYDVTRDEEEEDDAEVNFSGAGTDGQVKLRQECKDRTTVSITIRPTE